MNLPNIRQFSVQQLIDKNINDHHRTLDEMVDRFRNTILVRALQMKQGNIRQTARMLQVSTLTIKNWMDRYLVTERDNIEEMDDDPAENNVSA